jgi:flagellar protein FliT
MNDPIHAALLALSEQMVVAARAGDWEAVAAIEAERSEQIVAVSTTEPGALSLLKQLLAHTEEVRELARHERDRIGSDLEEHPHRHRALSAYLHAGAE